MDEKIKEIREAIKDRLTSGDEVFDAKYRSDPGPYARQLLCYISKCIYPRKSFRRLAGLTGLNYGSVYAYYYKTVSDINLYFDTKKDVEFIEYKIGIRKVYEQSRLIKSISFEIFKHNNGSEVASLINKLTGIEIKKSDGLNYIKTN